MVEARFGVDVGADEVDWQDESEEVPGEAEVAAMRTGDQVYRVFESFEDDAALE